MKRLPKERLEAMCKGKRRYDTQGDALDAAAVLGLERQREAYRCTACGKWHLTSRRASRPG
ncbi:MAG: hypothetical protein SFV32_09195 [Opitutaceae bacterium]|nr:hypothetical protein [Opitutaceae bacterium]